MKEGWRKEDRKNKERRKGKGGRRKKGRKQERKEEVKERGMEGRSKLWGVAACAVPACLRIWRPVSN